MNSAVRRFAGPVVLVVVLLLDCQPLQAQNAPAPDIVKQVLTARVTTGFRARARFVQTPPGEKNNAAVWQFAITGRYENGNRQLLYMLQRPEAQKGHALVLRRPTGGEISGFFFEPPDSVRPLTRGHMREPVFGSELLLEDVTDAFLYWPSHKHAGACEWKSRNCLMIESRPGPGTMSRYSRVVSWVIPDMSLIVRIEKFDADGRLAKTMVAEKVVKRGGTWLASETAIEPAEQRWRGRFVYYSGESDIEITADEFTPEHIKRVLDAPEKVPTTRRPGS